MKKYKDYVYIFLYGIVLLILLVGSNHLYGSNTDWISQHSVIPDYFRNLFYETGNLIPNFAYQIGAGQNIYHLSYYGLLSPVILISYLFPFMDMTTYIILASIILYLSSGFIMYYFMKQHFDLKLSLFSSLILLSLPPITYHFHHHIMFVWYIPFLILSLIGVDHLNKNKSTLLIISIFLIIMTNYYYSVCSILTILIYIFYQMIRYKQINIKNILKIIIRFIIPVLMAAIILLPTAYTILNGERVNNINITLKELLIPNLNNIFYGSFSVGTIGIIFISLLGLLTDKKHNKLLAIVLLVILFVPIFMYALNGMLYVRGKVLIPLIPIIIYSFITFLNKIEQFDFKKINSLTFLFCIIFLLVDTKNMYYVLEIIISLIIINKYKKDKTIILIYTIIFLIICSFISNKQENYVDINYYQKLNKPNISELLENDKSYYRSNVNYEAKNTVNKIYNNNYYNISIYSSTYNKYYYNFYNNLFGNNIKYRNLFITAGTDNELFNTFMGVRYIVDKKDKYGSYYQEIKTIDDISLYENKDAYPIIYISKNTGSINKYEELDFPYNMEYMMNIPITESGSSDVNSKIFKYDKEIENTSFTLNEIKEYQATLPDIFKDKILYLKFDLTYNQSCKIGDISIEINGIKNKLTCESWQYHNGNYRFEYIVPISDLKLDIKISKGIYQIENIKLYYSDKIFNKFQELNNLSIDKKNSIITGNVQLEEDSYLITSLPYDEGFEIYVNGQKKEIEKVNISFIGVSLKKGENNIIIKYKAPYYKLGVILSIIGLFSFIMIVLYERKR